MARRQDVDTPPSEAKEPESPKPPTEAQQDNAARASAVLRLVLKDLPEGVRGEPVPDADRPTLKMYTPNPLRGANTCVVGMAGDSSPEVDAVTVLADLRRYWGIQG